MCATGSEQSVVDTSPHWISLLPLRLSSLLLPCIKYSSTEHVFDSSRRLGSRRAAPSQTQHVTQTGASAGGTSAFLAGTPGEAFGWRVPFHSFTEGNRGRCRHPLLQVSLFFPLSFFPLKMDSWRVAYFLQALEVVFGCSYQLSHEKMWPASHWPEMTGF